jgi:hypothetical protein
MAINENLRERAVQVMANGNQSIGEMAEELGISDSTFWRIRQDPTFIEDLRKEIRSRFAPYATQAVHNIIRLANTADSENVRLSASKEILEKLGVSSKQEHELNIAQEIVIDIVTESE